MQKCCDFYAEIPGNQNLSSDVVKHIPLNMLLNMLLNLSSDVVKHMLVLFCSSMFVSTTFIDKVPIPDYFKQNLMW